MFRMSSLLPTRQTHLKIQKLTGYRLCGTPTTRGRRAIRVDHIAKQVKRKPRAKRLPKKRWNEIFQVREYGDRRRTDMYGGLHTPRETTPAMEQFTQDLVRTIKDMRNETRRD